MGRATLTPRAVLGLYTETPLHCGAESATGYVDLPVQRERHTRYPLIPGTALKGVLRDEVKALLGDQGGDTVRRLFGHEDATKAAGGEVAFGDGFLVAFPVRSSGAPFHWVTCPFVLERVFRALGVDGPGVEAPDAGKAWAKGAGEVLLEELRVVLEPLPAFFGFVQAAAGDRPLDRLLALVPGDDRGFAYTRSILPERLLILRDDDFRELVEIGTEVVTRIKLNALGTTRTIEREEAEELGLDDFERQGNLFVEELVPRETLFLSPLRTAGDGAPDLFASLDRLPVVRLGGDETVGRGVTHLTQVAGR